MVSTTFNNLWISSVLISFIPGPAMLYVAGQTLANGPRAGWHAVLGLHLGRYVHVFSAIASISVVLAVMPQLYAVIRVIGALYLLWLGFSVIMKVADAHLPDVGALEPTDRRSLLQSAWVEMLNPQTAMFFMAQLPLYVGPHDSNPMMKLILSGVLLNIIGSLADATSLFCARLLRVSLSQKSGMIRKVQLGGGSLLVGLGMHILLPAS